MKCLCLLSSKKQFADEAAEALAVIHAKDESNVESIHEDLRHQILDCKDVHKVDSSTGNMDFFNHMPRFLGKFLVWILTRLDIHGWIPASIIETDPYYTTCVISNLGSIKLNCGYHHLTNWGTCSVFCIIGEKSKRPVYHEDGTIEMREMLDLGLTIDERLADGYYYSKTIRPAQEAAGKPGVAGNTGQSGSGILTEKKHPRLWVFFSQINERIPSTTIDGSAGRRFWNWMQTVLLQPERFRF